MIALWAGLALADAGSKSCTMRGVTLNVRWKEDGTVDVFDGRALLVSVDVGDLKGTTTMQCRPGDKLKFLTDTHEVPGKITLETVNIGLSDILDTMDPARFAAKPTPRPTRPSPRRPAPTPPARVKSTGERAAEACVNTKVWDGYDQGWRVRSVTSGEMKSGERMNYAVALVKGNAYEFYGCAQSSVSNLDMVIYRPDGSAVSRDGSFDRQPSVTYTPTVSGTYHVVLFEPKPGKQTVGAALGVVYR